jgi:DNA-binding CsgD family transcriptional regulator/predicted enzyme related to lactoylglutathione lyase
MRRSRGRPPHDDILTPAEWRTVHAVRHGLANREIAERRKISVDAVKFHVANAIAKLGLENRRELRRWRGAPKDSPLPTRQGNMKNDPDIIGIGQISRSVKNVKTSEAWYRDTVGLTHLCTFGNLAFFDCGGTRLMLSETEELQPSESLVYLRVQDIDASYDRLQAQGVKMINAPHMIHRHEDGTEEWMAFFEDPEGRPLAIMASVHAQ